MPVSTRRPIEEPVSVGPTRLGIYGTKVVIPTFRAQDADLLRGLRAIVALDGRRAVLRGIEKVEDFVGTSGVNRRRWLLNINHHRRIIRRHTVEDNNNRQEAGYGHDNWGVRRHYYY